MKLRRDVDHCLGHNAVIMGLSVFTLMVVLLSRFAVLKPH